jgi:ribosomal protein S12 methylthiotransferase accessory factor
MFRYDRRTQHHTGPLGRLRHPAPARDEPQVWMASVTSLPTPDDDLRAHLRPRMQGTGTATDRAGAVLRGTCEALERFCSTVFLEKDVVWASAQELGSMAVDLESFPRCSRNEYDDPKCPIHPPQSSARIRWTRAVSLMTGEVRFVPLRSVFIAPSAVPEEKFLHAISTGCAAHTDYVQALVSATLEIVERDALSLAWLQRLPLPRIDFSGDPLERSELWQMTRRGSRDIEYLLFDATTDLKIPVVYGLRRSAIDRRLHTLVACAASPDVREACRKAILELSAFAVWLRSERRIPLDPKDFNRFHHGPLYMAQESQSDAFQVLLQSRQTRRIAEVNTGSPFRKDDSTGVVLEKLIRRLREHGHEAFAADLSTRETMRSGIRVVRVVIPSLMPFSCIHRARFLGHSRLYMAPKKMGYSVNEEEGINPLPQPFG